MKKIFFAEKSALKKKKKNYTFVICAYPGVRKLFNETGNDPDEHIR